MPIQIELIIDGICGVLFSFGGWHFLWMRRYLMPVLIAISVSIITHSWWIGITVLPVIGTLCLGYFGSNFFGRGLWLFLQAVVIGACSFLTDHLAWYFYIPYCVISFVLAASLYNIFQIIGDIIFGVALGSIVFLVH